MDSLRLPERTRDILKLDWPSPTEPGYQTEGFEKWYIYTIDSVPNGSEELALEGMKADGFSYSESDDELLRLGYLKAAKQDFPAPDIQHILDHHIRLVEQQNAEAYRTRYSGDVYIWGFVVITRADWREHGVIAVHFDEDRGQYKVRQCRLPVNELGNLFSLMEIDTCFDQVCKDYDDSGNDGPDNKGGPQPAGEWVFVVYGTGTLSWNGYAQSEVHFNTPDPRGFHAGYPDNETSLAFLFKELSAVQVNEGWPLEYARFVRDPTDGEDGEKCVTKCHPSLFVHMRDHNPHDYTPSTTNIIKMEWDHNIERSDEELKKIGRESQVTIQSCAAKSLVETLFRMADEEMVKPMEGLKISGE